MEWKNSYGFRTDNANKGLIHPPSIKGPNVCKYLLGRFPELTAEYKKKQGNWAQNSKFNYMYLKTENTAELDDWLKTIKVKHHSSYSKKIRQLYLISFESKKRKLPEQDTKEEN